MEKTTSECHDHATHSIEKGTGMLFWGWVLVTVLNAGMVIASLALFAP